MLATNFFYFWTMYFFSFKMIVFSIWFEFLVIVFNQMENLIPKWTNFSWTFQLMAVYNVWSAACTNSHKYALENTTGYWPGKTCCHIAISTTHMLLKPLQCSNLNTSAFEFFAIIKYFLILWTKWISSSTKVTFQT